MAATAARPATHASRCSIGRVAGVGAPGPACTGRRRALICDLLASNFTALSWASQSTWQAPGPREGAPHRRLGALAVPPAPCLGVLICRSPWPCSFPGLKEGDGWCLCAARWHEALAAGVAPPVVLEATHSKTLQVRGPLAVWDELCCAAPLLTATEVAGSAGFSNRCLSCCPLVSASLACALSPPPPTSPSPPFTHIHSLLSFRSWRAMLTGAPLPSRQRDKAWQVPACWLRLDQSTNFSAAVLALPTLAWPLLWQAG